MLLRRVAVCLAFASWCFLNAWVQLAQAAPAYYARFSPWQTVGVPVLCWEMVVTAGMLAAWRLFRGGIAIHRLFLAASCVPVGIAAVALVNVLPAALRPLATALVTSRFFWAAVGILSIAPMVFAMRRPLIASRFFQSILLYSWPVLAVIFVYAARESFLPYRAIDYADGPLAAPLPSNPAGVRVVWIIFDEWSQAITFGNRPAGLDLPNFDRLRAESFYATSAQPPGGFTRISIPSLLLGEHVEAAVARGPAELQVRLSSRRDAVSWSSLLNVFDTARQMGFNTALAGWFHPYGRVLNRSLTRCYWTAGQLAPGVEEPMQPESLPAAMRDRARRQLAALPLIHRLIGLHAERDARQADVEKFRYLLERALEITADPSIGLVFLHLPVPHPPGIYDRSQKIFTTDPARGYLDNLALADASLGILRQKMEDAGVWNRTAVMVSADHSLRPSMWRDQHVWNEEDESAARGNSSAIPFMLKLPGQDHGLTFERRLRHRCQPGHCHGHFSGQPEGPGRDRGVHRNSAIRAAARRERPRRARSGASRRAGASPRTDSAADGGSSVAGDINNPPGSN